LNLHSKVRYILVDVCEWFLSFELRLSLGLGHDEVTEVKGEEPQEEVSPTGLASREVGRNCEDPVQLDDGPAEDPGLR